MRLLLRSAAPADPPLSRLVPTARPRRRALTSAALAAALTLILVTPAATASVGSPSKRTAAIDVAALAIPVGERVSVAVRAAPREPAATVTFRIVGLDAAGHVVREAQLAPEQAPSGPVARTGDLARGGVARVLVWVELWGPGADAPEAVVREVWVAPHLARRPLGRAVGAAGERRVYEVPAARQPATPEVP